jgi:hypothetical protein
MTPVPAPAAAAGGGVQLAPAEAPLEAISDDDILPADAIELVEDAAEAVAVPESLNALDGLGIAEAEPLDEVDEGEEPDMAVDRGTRRGTGRAGRRAGGGRTGRTRRPRKCPECNSENDPGARECANCGAQIRGAPRKQGGGLKKILVVLILLVLVVGGGAFAAGYLALGSMPQAFRDLWTSMGLPSKGAVEEETAPETDGEAEEPGKEETQPAGELPPEGYAPDMGEDVADAPSAREDSAIGMGAGGIAVPDATPDLGGGGPAAPSVSTGGGDGIDE